MPRPRIAIATCDKHDRDKVDDALLIEAFGERDCEAEPVVWDDGDAAWGAFDLCLVSSTWDYNRNYGEFLAWAWRVEAATALLNPAETIAWSSDKTYLRELAGGGVRTVPTIWAERGSEARLDAILAEQGWEEAVVKPVVDLGAENLHRVRRGEGSEALASVLQSRGAMVQPFLPSLEEQGEMSLIYVDGTLTHAVRKRAAPGDFRVQSIWGGTVTSEEPGRAEVELAELALSQLDEVPLYGRVDLVEGPTGEHCLIELELIEPNLYLTQHPPAAAALAEAALLRIDVDA
jgi:glutathione synthase/RimK-type ligase-like ATP-grasp enzyme